MLYLFTLLFTEYLLDIEARASPLKSTGDRRRRVNGGCAGGPRPLTTACAAGGVVLTVSGSAFWYVVL